MFNKPSFIIKEEIFRHILVEEFPLLNEAPVSLPQVVSWFHSLDKNIRRRIIKEINTIFLYNLSQDGAYRKYIIKNYLQDENLCLNVFLYVSGKYSLMEEYFKPYVTRMYANYLLRYYLNPKGFFGAKAAITGNKQIDQIVLEIIQEELQRELASKDIKDLPSEFENLLSDLETNIENVFNTNEKQIKDRLDESFLDPNKIEKLLNSVQHIFYLNNATIKTMRTILKSMNTDDMKKITSGGRNNTSNILSLGIMRRTAELLYKIQLSDPIMDKMLGLLAYRLMSQNSAYFNKLKPALGNFIYKKMQEIKSIKPKNKVLKYATDAAAKKAEYAGHY